MLELLKKLEELEKIASEKDKEYEENPESEEAEKAFDEAYKKEFDFFNEVAHKLVVVTSGKIDFKTARVMLQTKREEIKELFSR